MKFAFEKNVSFLSYDVLYYHDKFFLLFNFFFFFHISFRFKA